MSEKLITGALSAVTNVKDPSILIALIALAALGIVGMAMYVLLVALDKLGGKK